VVVCVDVWLAAHVALASEGGGGLISILNQNSEYNATTILNNQLNADTENLLNINIGSNYYDFNSFSTKFSNSKKPLYLSLNIQCLMSKFDALKSFVQDLSVSHIPVDIIAIQETWSILYPELVYLPGFQPIVFSGRVGMRGGGVGFYIREGLQYEKIANLSTFHEKTFESLSIELQYPNKKIIISNIYRSPNPPPRASPTEHINQFIHLFNNHLESISNRNKMASFSWIAILIYITYRLTQQP